MKIGNKNIGYGQTPIISAELGISHNGDLPTALKMIDECAAAGADGVKVQYFKTSDFCTDKDKTIEYQQIEQAARRWPNALRETITENYIDFFQRHEIDLDFVKQCYERAKEKGLLFGITTTSAEGVREVADYCDYFKVASDQVSQDKMIAEIRKHQDPELVRIKGNMCRQERKQIPAIISTGQLDFVGTSKLYNELNNNPINTTSTLWLHCESEYPCKNPKLWKIRHMQELGYLTGYSDHTIGNEACIRAAELGAVFLECHVTLDKTAAGSDNWWSLDMSDLKQLVEAIK